MDYNNMYENLLEKEKTFISSTIHNLKEECYKMDTKDKKENFELKYRSIIEEEGPCIQASDNKLKKYVIKENIQKFDELLQEESQHRQLAERLNQVNKKQFNETSNNLVINDDRLIQELTVISQPQPTEENRKNSQENILRNNEDLMKSDISENFSLIISGTFGGSVSEFTSENSIRNLRLSAGKNKSPTTRTRKKVQSNSKKNASILITTSKPSLKTSEDSLRPDKGSISRFRPVSFFSSVQSLISNNNHGIDKVKKGIRNSTKQNNSTDHNKLIKRLVNGPDVKILTGTDDGWSMVNGKVNVKRMESHAKGCACNVCICNPCGTQRKCRTINFLPITRSSRKSNDRPQSAPMESKFSKFLDSLQCGQSKCVNCGGQASNVPQFDPKIFNDALTKFESFDDLKKLNYCGIYCLHKIIQRLESIDGIPPEVSISKLRRVGSRLSNARTKLNTKVTGAVQKRFKKRKELDSHQSPTVHINEEKYEHPEVMFDNLEEPEPKLYENEKNSRMSLFPSYRRCNKIPSRFELKSAFDLGKASIAGLVADIREHTGKLESYDLGMVCLNIDEKYKTLLEGKHSLVLTLGNEQNKIEVGSVEFKFSGEEIGNDEEEIPGRTVQYSMGSEVNETVDLPQSVCRAIRKEIIKSAAAGKYYGSDVSGILEATTTNPAFSYNPDDQVKQSLASALDRANKHVIDALSNASRNVTQALDQANRDVECALIYVMTENTTSGENTDDMESAGESYEEAADSNEKQEDKEEPNEEKKKCDCNDPCICLECPDDDAKGNKDLPECDCPGECECDGCPSGRGKPPAGECKCKKCFCDPCSDKSKQRATGEERPDCTCDVCICEKCLAAPACDCKDECICPVCPYKERTCSCAVCLCDDCEFLKPQKTTDTCSCIICICDDCPKSGATEIRPPKPIYKAPKCRCAVCICDDCDADKLAKQVEESSCTCPVCICDACPNLGGGLKTHYECTCWPNCRCDKCEDPTVTPEPKLKDKKPGNAVLTVHSVKKDCTCTNGCKCPKCEFANATINSTPDNANPVKDDVSKRQTSEITCMCTICTCSPCDAKPLKTTQCMCVECNCNPCGAMSESIGLKRKRSRPVSSKPVISEPTCSPLDSCPFCLSTPCISKLPKIDQVCVCPICVCNPCDRMDGKPSSAKNELEQVDRKLIGGDAFKSHSSECLCRTCYCRPCIKDPNAFNKSASATLECKCPKCVCISCDYMQQISTKLVEQITMRKEQGKTNCTCPKCVCSPCGMGEQLSTDCTCSKCVCTPCDRLLNQIGDTIRDTTTKPGCNCEVCTCQECHPKPMVQPCNCSPECDCPICNDPNKQAAKIENEDPTGHADECTCDLCLCEPCKLEMKTSHPQGKQIDLPVPVCGHDGPHPAGCKCSTCQQSNHPKGCQCDICQNHPVGCKCTTCLEGSHPLDCKCDDCKESNHPPGCRCTDCLQSNHPIGCKCDVCQRDGTHPPGCQCEVCCQQQPKAAETKSSKEPCPPSCKCGVCTCKTCKPYFSKITEQPVGHPIGCKCAKCDCKPCKMMLQPEEQTTAAVRSETCNCIPCNCCDSCKPTSKTSTTKEEIKREGEDPLASKEGCTCDDCKCENKAKETLDPNVSAHTSWMVVNSMIKACGGEGRSQSVTQTLTSSSPKCICSDCKCSKCPSKEPKSEGDWAKCDCPTPCGCQDCADPNIKRSSIATHVRGGANMGDGKFPFETIKPCTCPGKCNCVTCPGLQESSPIPPKKACSCEHVCDCLLSPGGLKEEQKAYTFTFEDIKPCTCPNPCECSSCPGRNNQISPQQRKSAGAEMIYNQMPCKCDNKLTCKVTCSSRKVYSDGRKSKVDVITGTFQICDVRKLTEDSLLVKWSPANVPCLTGYEIDVNGCLSHRVRNKNRCIAVLFNVSFKQPVQILVFPMSKDGRIQPPAGTVFNNPNC